jgi:1-acyl-sn-glycerol-3-phosphate acyltransferase
MIVLYPIFYFLLAKKERFPKAFRLKKIWARWIFSLPGIFTKINYITPANKLPQPAVYCANHGSYLDIIAGYLVIPNYFVSMGKKELGKVPLFRSFFKEMNILVDRKSMTGSHRAFVQAGEQLEKGNSIFLFPEGGILSNTGNFTILKMALLNWPSINRFPLFLLLF